MGCKPIYARDCRLFRCSSDDDDKGVDSPGTLIGTWEHVSYEYIIKKDGVVIEQGSERGDYTRLEYFADGTFNDYENDEGHWQVCNSGTYTYTDGMLHNMYTYDTDNDCIELYKVLTLTGTTLIMEGTYPIEPNSPYEEYSKITFKRIK